MASSPMNNDEAWLFTSFRGDGDGLRLAYSENGTEWADLQKIYLKSEVGSKRLLDPHLLRDSSGLYHLVWATGPEDAGVGYATSKDLEHWSEQRFLPLMAGIEGARSCRGPELTLDPRTGEFIVVWSSSVRDVAGATQARTYYSVTKDFGAFSAPKPLIEPGFGTSDASLVKVGDGYRLFLKEADDAAAKRWGDIHVAKASHPLGPWTLLPEKPLEDKRATGASALVLGERTLLYLDRHGDDRYRDDHYTVHETRDWVSWKEITGDTAVLPSQRHGSIERVSATLLKQLRTEETARVASVPKPILGGFTADPSIRVFGDTYYVYPTTDKPHWNTTEFVAWSSKDLITWKREGVILDVTKDIAWADLQAWAPDCIERDGTYYFYFCARGKIGVATSKSPAGPFKDALGRPLLKREGKITTNTIDPAAFIDDDGQAYLYWGNGDHGMVYKLKPDMITLEGDPVRIDMKEFREGIVVFKRNGLYYFMWSIDDARSPNYRVGWGTATSPLGPVKPGGPDFIVLQRNGAAQGTAHHGVVQVPGTERWYVAYHRHAVPGGSGYKRETCLVRMEFNPDGSIKPMDPLSTPFGPGDKGEPVGKD